MRMTISQVIDQVRNDLFNNLNGVLESASLKKLKYEIYAPRIETSKMKMGVYLDSPEGQVFSSDGRSQSIDIVLDCILDDDIRHSNWGEEYLSVVISYLSNKKYGVSSTPFSAVTWRTDLDHPINGFGVAMRVVTYDSDMDIF